MRRNLSFKSIEEYRTAISRPIKLSTGLDVGQDPMLQNFLKSILREKTKALQPFPAWDLSFVLFSLVKEPFESLLEISLKYLTFRQFFSPSSLQAAEGLRYMLSATGL